MEIQGRDSENSGNAPWHPALLGRSIPFWFLALGLCGLLVMPPVLVLLQNNSAFPGAPVLVRPFLLVLLSLFWGTLALLVALVMAAPPTLGLLFSDRDTRMYRLQNHILRYTASLPPLVPALILSLFAPLQNRFFLVPVISGPAESFLPLTFLVFLILPGLILGAEELLREKSRMTREDALCLGAGSLGHLVKLVVPPSLKPLSGLCLGALSRLLSESAGFLLLGLFLAPGFSLPAAPHILQTTLERGAGALDWENLFGVLLLWALSYGLFRLGMKLAPGRGKP